MRSGISLGASYLCKSLCPPHQAIAVGAGLAGSQVRAHHTVFIRANLLHNHGEDTNIVHFSSPPILAWKVLLHSFCEWPIASAVCASIFCGGRDSNGESAG